MRNREIKAKLLKQGYQYVRSKGDHHIFARLGARRPIVLVGDDGTDVPGWQVKRVLAQARTG